MTTDTKKTKKEEKKTTTATGKDTAAEVGFQSSYSDAVKENLNKAINREPFSYDVNSDKLFSQYKTSYENAGKKAMQDTVGNSAILSGGYANSYGVTAGQQAYNDYMTKLSDKVPELEQIAYNRYRDEENSAYNRLNALLAMENTEYDRYRDSVQDRYNDRDFNYKVEQDKLAQSNIDRDYNRNVYENDRDYNRNVYENDRDYNRNVYENDRDYNRNVYESDRDYNRNTYESDRDYKYKKSMDEKSSDSEEKDDETFNPQDAYEFLNKYNEQIYTDEEFVEAMFQMYGDKDGFYEWLSTVKIPGDIVGRTYLELLYQMYPELNPNYGKPKKKTEQEIIESSATNGGASVPSSTGLWGLQTGNWW